MNILNAWRDFVGFVRPARVYLVFNFRSQSQYRAAFVWQIVSMALNDTIWLTFWLFFFEKFPVLGTWTLPDVITMWSVLAAGFGLGIGIAGNANYLATLILKGELDPWLLYPRRVLPHLLLGKMSVTSWGDFLFGVFAYVFLVHPSFESMLMFAFLVPCVAVTFIGFSVLVGSLGFFLGSAESLSEQLRFALVTFGTYPPSIFDGVAKLMLFTVIPAGFCSYLPVEALKHHSIEYALATALGSIVILAVGTSVFYFGLSRYESGNLMDMRG